MYKGQAQYNGRKAGVSAAIAVSVLIPFVICAGCFLVRMRETIVEKYQNHRSSGVGSGGGYGGGGGGKTNNFQEYSDNTNNQPANDPSRARKSSKHEGVYYTNEPLDMYTRN